MPYIKSRKINHNYRSKYNRDIKNKQSFKPGIPNLKGVDHEYCKFYDPRLMFKYRKRCDHGVQDFNDTVSRGGLPYIAYYESDKSFMAVGLTRNYTKGQCIDIIIRCMLLPNRRVASRNPAIRNVVYYVPPNKVAEYFNRHPIKSNLKMSANSPYLTEPIKNKM